LTAAVIGSRLARALLNLHAAGIAHGDLKLENILHADLKAARPHAEAAAHCLGAAPGSRKPVHDET